MVVGNNKTIITKLKFNFANGASFTLGYNENLNETTYITSIKLTEQISQDNNLPVGINSGNVIDIELTSKNKALLPNNESSVYFGYMNNTASIDIHVYEGDKDRFLGKYYVTKWRAQNTSDAPDKVIIKAINLFGYISSFKVPNIQIFNGMNIDDYVYSMFEELNKELPSDKKVIIDKNNIVFNTFPKMNFCNLDADNIGDYLNIISQATLTNIYIDRNNILRTDFNCDDSYSEATYSLNMFVNVSLGTGVLVDYDSFKLKYSLGKIQNVECIASLHNIECFKGNNDIDTISLGSAVYKINRIEVYTDSEAYAEIINTQYTKNKMVLTISTNKDCNVSVDIYGQRLDNTELIKENSGTSVLEITNKLITGEYTDKYVDYMTQLIKIKNNSISVTGYITPDIRVGDIIYINTSNSMGTEGYYKVVSIDWILSNTSKATLNVIKTFNMSYSLDLLMNKDNELLYKTLCGSKVSTNRFTYRNDMEEDYCRSQLNEQLNTLENILYGG